MADIDQVDAALAELVRQADDLDESTRAKIPDRSVSLLVRDLDVAYAGRLSSEGLADVAPVPVELHREAQLRLAMTSDDLIDLVGGRLGFGSGWATGRIRVDARLRDILELRRFL